MNPVDFERVRTLLGDVFGLPPAQITTETSQETLAGWDSLQHLNLVLSLEQQFGLRLTPAETESLRNVQTILELLARKGRTAPEPAAAPC